MPAARELLAQPRRRRRRRRPCRRATAVPPSAAMLCATLAAPPSRTCSDSNRTTGTGASGEMRVTRPTMKRSSITSPTTSTRQAGESRRRDRARGAASSARQRHATAADATVGRGRQRDDHQEQHQDFGVAEVVLEQPGGQQRRRWWRARPRRASRCVRLGSVATRSRMQRDDEPQPERQRRQAALGGDLQRVVVQVRVDRARRRPADRESDCVVAAAATMFGPTPVSGCAAIMRSPSRSIATRSRTVGSFMSNIDG